MKINLICFSEIHTGKNVNPRRLFGKKKQSTQSKNQTEKNQPRIVILQVLLRKKKKKKKLDIPHSFMSSQKTKQKRLSRCEYLLNKSKMTVFSFNTYSEDSQ